MALQTITSKHEDLRQISIRIYDDKIFTARPAYVQRAFNETAYGQWADLDRLLIQLWESYAIRPKILYSVVKDKEEAVRVFMGVLLPEVMGRGIIELVNLL